MSFCILGTPGCCHPEQVSAQKAINYDSCSTRIVMIHILLPWNASWEAFWDPNKNRLKMIYQIYPILGWIDSMTRQKLTVNGILHFENELSVNAILLQSWYDYVDSCQKNYNYIHSNTQQSINAFKNLTMHDVDPLSLVTGGTFLHNQMNTNLCHSFAIVTALRNAMINYVLELYPSNSLKLILIVR